ncbi:hypothetical protein G3I48_13430 [Streptomyces griseus]|nr:hypothetical protein [Streptomyces griseus]
MKGSASRRPWVLSLAAGASEAVVAEAAAGRHPAERVPEDLRLAHEPRRGGIRRPAPPGAVIPAPRGRGPVELTAAELASLTGPVSPALLGDGLARQLVGLLEAGRIRPRVTS